MGKVPRERRAVERLALLLGVVGKIDHRRLEAGKAHVERVPLDARARQVVHAAPALLRQLVHRLAAGIGHPEHTRGLVEAFARRVIARRADENKVGIIPHVHEQRVPAGHAQRQERRLQLRERQIIRGDVAADMMHRNERYAQRVGDGLGDTLANVLERDSPTSTAPIRPGAYVTATASMSRFVTPASASALSVSAAMASTCLREAISGTTPP